MGAGRYAPGEAHVVFRRRIRAPYRSRGCLFFGPRGHRARDYLNPPYVHQLVELAAAGMPVLCADWGGVDTFGNDVAVSRAVSGATFLKSAEVKAAPGRIYLVGMSMGAVTALNYARLVGPSAVAAIALITPPIHLARLHDATEREELALAIEAAHGGRERWEAVKHAKDPAQNAHELTGIPIGVWYSPADEHIPADLVRDFRDRLPDTVTLRSVGDLDHASAAWSVPGSQLASWLQGHC